MSQSDNNPLVTRKSGVRYCREEHGIPITESTVEKRAMRKEGPPVAGYLGRRELYYRDHFLSWAQSLISTKPKNLNAA